MAVKLGLWSLTLIPGETYPISVRKDFQITNAALGEELKDNNGRSVVKVTHEPLPSAFFEASDSEDDDSDIEGDLPSDEFELDSEEGFKKIVKEAKEAAANGDIPAADDDDEDEDFEEDDEDSEDDEDMSDEDDDELLETTVLCALTAGKIEQANLNLTFTEGDVVMFEVTGDNAVHLMGNYLEQFPDRYDSDSDSEFDSDEQDDYSDLELEDLEDDEEEDVPVKITEINEVSEPKKAIKSKAAKVESQPAAVPEKKRKAEDAGDVSMTSTDGLSKNQKKKLAKKAKTDEPAVAPAAAAAPAPKEKKDIKAGKRTLASGLEYEDIKTGTGPVAKPGKRLSMRYIGKLTNGKQFDANTAGAPFSFVLGRGEVIKGWDQGLNGMAVGGERKLSIPANLAYGKQKLPGIPANSTLNFEVKLLAVK